MPMTGSWNSHVPSYKPRQHIIQFPQSPPVFNPAFPLTQTTLLYSILNSKSFRDSLVLLFCFLYTAEIVASQFIWINDHTSRQPKVQSHPNLFVKHHSLEELFTYVYKKNPTAALLISWHLLFLAIKPEVSSVFTHSLYKFCKAKDMMHQVLAI